MLERSRREGKKTTHDITELVDKMQGDVVVYVKSINF